MSKEEKIARALGEYDGQMEMLKRASEQMFEWLDVNEAGETSAEDVLELNRWVERMKQRIQNRLTRAIVEIGE